jgi:hypothetical protein
VKTYREEIIKIWKENSDIELFQLSPLTPVINENDVENLVVGINPSNSFKSLNRVIKRNLEVWNSNSKLVRIKSDEEYQNFLSFKYFEENEDTIHLIQKLCHQSHYHFQKQTEFLNKTGLFKYDFIDLFPIWKIKQLELLEELKQIPKIEKTLIYSFLNYINRNNFKRIIFLNRGSFDLFSKYFKFQLKLKSPLKIDTGGKHTRTIISGLFETDYTKLEIYVIGIGGRDNNTKLINEINKIQFFNI